MTPREPQPDRWADLRSLEERVDKERRGGSAVSADMVRRHERDLHRSELGDFEDD